MRLKYISTIISFISLLLINAPAYSQLGLGIFKKRTRVRLTPIKAENYQLKEEQALLKQGYFHEPVRWIVFSDRAGNTTYKRPGSEIQVQTLGFMDPCYVIRKKGDYLELVKYDAKLLKNPHKGKIDLKSAEYLGWINKDRLLLWQSALQDKQTGFIAKGITCFKSENAIITPSLFAGNESLLLFSGPFQKEKIGQCRMEDLFYIFKQSEDGKQYLVGRKPQITPDTRNEAVSGWISKDLIKLWGARSFFTWPYSPENRLLNTEEEIEQNIIFYSNSVVPSDTIRDYSLDVCCKDNKLLEQIFPVQAQVTQVNNRQKITTGVFKSVLDRTEDEVINTQGNKIPYTKINCLLSCQHKANIVFVVDYTSEHGMATVQSAVQYLAPFFDTSALFDSYKFGAAVYRNDLNGRYDTAMRKLTSVYTDLESFFQKCLSKRNTWSDNQISEGTIPGLSQAVRLLKHHKDETNIIVLIGSRGNNIRPGEYNDIIQQLSYTNTRLLIHQTYGGLTADYNNFYLQGKTLIEQTANIISENKKEKTVTLEDVLSNPDFSLVKGDSGVYYLNYPKNSMTQGYMIIPDKGQTKQHAFLVRNLDSLMIQIHDDNERIERSLKRYFSTGSGVRNTRILAPFRFLYPAYGDNYLPAPFLKEALTIDAQPFYIPAWVESALPGDSSGTPSPSFGLLVSAAEYEQVIRALSGIGGNPDDSSRSGRATYRHLRREVKRYRSAYHRPIGGRISRLSFAALLEYTTGYKSMNPIWAHNELRMIKKKNKMSRAEVLSFLTVCREKAYWLTDNTQNKAIRFHNNSQVYYWLTAANLP